MTERPFYLRDRYYGRGFVRTIRRNGDIVWTHNLAEARKFPFRWAMDFQVEDGRAMTRWEYEAEEIERNRQNDAGWVIVEIRPQPKTCIPIPSWLKEVGEMSTSWDEVDRAIRFPTKKAATELLARHPRRLAKAKAQRVTEARAVQAEHHARRLADAEAKGERP